MDVAAGKADNSAGCLKLSNYPDFFYMPEVYGDEKWENVLE